MHSTTEAGRGAGGDIDEIRVGFKGLAGGQGFGDGQAFIIALARRNAQADDEIIIRGSADGGQNTGKEVLALGVSCRQRRRSAG